MPLKRKSNREAEPEATKKITDSRTTIIVAIIGLVGAVVGALFTNWDKLFPKLPSANSNTVAVNNIAAPVQNSNNANQQPTADSNANRQPTTDNTVKDPIVSNNEKPSTDIVQGTKASNQQIIKKTTKTTTTSRRKKDRTGQIIEETQTTTETTTVSVIPRVEEGLVQRPPGLALHEEPVFPIKATFIINEKESEPIVIEGSSIPKFPNIPCNKEVTFRLYYKHILVKTGAPFLEKKQRINCKNPKIEINFEEDTEPNQK